VVMIEATIPKSGLRRGQKIDCYVSAIMGAKSLRGGRLLTAPLTTAEVNRDLVLGIASGALQPEDPQRPTMAKITTGVDLTEDVTTLFVNTTDQSITLLIDSAHASFWTANEIARVINSDLTFETSGEQLAKSVSPGAVQVKIPRHYRDNPVGFVAEVLDVGIDTPHTAARVILNARTGTVIVTGEVEISPVVITHKSFTVEVGDQQPAGPSSSGPFRSIQDQNTRQSPQQLKDLLDALNQLRVPTADIIAILRELHTTGKLHAELIER
jgi:flagellar P-ring protein FlgI